MTHDRTDSAEPPDDFLFCPYSVYLHQVYGFADEEVCKAELHKAGIIAHQQISNGQETGVIRNLPVYSKRYRRVYSVIDEYEDQSAEKITFYISTCNNQLFGLILH